MLRSYRERVRPGVEAADLEALERIGGRWRLTEAYPRGTFALLDRAGHALPHEQPELLGALLREWLGRVERP
jgi:pimeloyl-ACP methyl ester carboxylesterase